MPDSKIEKAPAYDSSVTGAYYCHLLNQRDADHTYYTSGEGRRQIHQEEVKEFVKWIEAHRQINIASVNRVEVEWAYIIPLIEIEALLKSAGREEKK